MVCFIRLHLFIVFIVVKLVDKHWMQYITTYNNNDFFIFSISILYSIWWHEFYKSTWCGFCIQQHIHGFLQTKTFNIKNFHGPHKH
jgi:hypothetical protein